MIKFLITLTFAALFIGVVGFFGFEIVPAYFFRTLLFLFISTAGLYRFLLRTKQQRPDFFVQFYLATMVVKLIAYGAYIFIVATSQAEKAVYDVAFFMVVYFIFTAIEIGFLYRQVNQ